MVTDHAIFECSGTTQEEWIAEALRNERAGARRLTDAQRTRLIEALGRASPPCPTEKKDMIYRDLPIELGKPGETVPDIARAEMASMMLDIARSQDEARGYRAMTKRLTAEMEQRDVAERKPPECEIIRGPWPTRR